MTLRFAPSVLSVPAAACLVAGILAILSVAAADSHASVNVAHISQGGNVTAYSSILTGGSPNDAIGGTDSCYPVYCETGTFIFNRYDADQWFQISLAHAYPLHEITSTQSGGSGDRSVWDLLEILTRNGSGPWVSWGYLPGDWNIPTSVTFTMDPPVVATEIKCRYGRYSPHHGGGGSRVYEVYAYTDQSSHPAYEIVSAEFDRQVYQNGVDTAHLTVVTRSNWGHGDNLTLAVDLTPSVGSPFHMGYDHFTLGPGGERVSYFSWAVPEAEYVWEFSALVTLSDDSNLRAPLIGVDLTHAFVGNPLDEGTLQQAQDVIADCWLDSDWECVARLTAMVPGVSIAANLALFVDGMCNAGELHRVGRSEEGWAKFGGASIAAVKILLSVAPGLSEVISIASAVHSYSMAAYTCANTDFFQRIYQGGFRDAVPPGALVDSLAVWIQSGAHAVGVDFANILLLEADCATRVEADGSWATADSLGLNFVMVSEIDSVGSVTWVTKNVYRFGNDESSNPHSDGRLIVSSRANQAMNVGLLHRTSADTLVFLRYPAFGVTDSTVVSVVVADSIPVPMLEVDLNGDGTVDFLWYPGEASTVEDALSGAKSEVPVLSLASIPNPTTGPTAFVLHNAVSLKGVSLSVYDVAGREVRRLLVGELSPGVHNVVWDGRADDGRQVASGIYYCVVSHAGGGSTTKRLVVVR